MLQGFIISGWERCPFATMAALVFHASSSPFQALQPSAAVGQSCALLGAAPAGQAHIAAVDGTWCSSLSCSIGCQLLFSNIREGVSGQLPLQKHCGVM